MGLVSTVEWVEVARDVFVCAYEPLTINICVIRDRDCLVVVDSRASATEGAQLAADLTWFAPARVQALINTHAHFDHTFGNQHFGNGSATAVPIYGHHLLPAHLDQYERSSTSGMAQWKRERADPGLGRRCDHSADAPGEGPSSSINSAPAASSSFRSPRGTVTQTS